MLSGYIAVDVRPELTRLWQPVYAVWDAEDTVAPVSEAISRLRAAVPDATIRVRPGLGHSWGAADQRWTDDVVAWLDSPGRHRGERDRGDAEPAGRGPDLSTHALVPPSSTHLALAPVIAALAAAPSRRRHDPRSTTRPAPARSPAGSSC